MNPPPTKKLNGYVGDNNNSARNAQSNQFNFPNQA